MRSRNPLTPHPENETCNEWLRYLVQSLEPQAAELSFLVSLWNYSLSHGGLTPKQIKALTPYIDEAVEFLKENFPIEKTVKHEGNVVSISGRIKNND